jgi:hypothetical protein
MPRYKVLNGVSHNIGHSFTSLMNYAQDDYSMGHILRFARETGIKELTIDFMTGIGRPATLLRAPISQLPTWYTKMFWNMVVRSGSERSLVKAATLTLRYDLTRSRSYPVENPYTCEVSISDDRGKEYRSYFDGWWHVERGRPLPRSRCGWNPLGWFRRRLWSRG